MASGQDKVLASISRPSARDLSSYQNYAMKVDTSGNVDYSDSSAGGVTLGPLTNKPAAETGAECEIAIAGTARLIVNGTVNGGIAIGAYIGSNNAYKGVNVTADKGAYFAIALEASAADADLIEVLLVGPSTISTT